MQVALFILGAALVAAGVVLLTAKKKPAGGRNTIELLGMKFQVGGPALVLVVMGCALALAGAGLGDAPAESHETIARDGTGRSAQPEPKRTLPAEEQLFFRPAMVFPAEAIRETEFEVQPGMTAENGARVLAIERCEFGAIEEHGAAVRVTFRFRNITARPITLSVRRDYFELKDNHGRKAAFLSFSAPPAEELLGAGEERTIVVVFGTKGWHGKEDAAQLLYLSVAGFVPIVRARWEIRALPAQAA